MEETEDSTNKNKNWVQQGRSFRGCSRRADQYHNFNTQYHQNYGYNYLNNRSSGFFNQNFRQPSYPALLPLPPILPLQINSTIQQPVLLHQNQRLVWSNNQHFQKTCWKKQNKILSPPPPPLVPLPPPPPAPATCSNAQVDVVPAPTLSTAAGHEGIQQQLRALNLRRVNGCSTATPQLEQLLTPPRRPDSGGVEGQVICLLANHFRVQFDSSQKIYHYDVQVSPNPSKEVARLLKQKLVLQDNNSSNSLLGGANPAYDGRSNLYSPIKFRNDKLEFFINLPVSTITSTSSSVVGHQQQGQKQQQQLNKLFRININLVSKLDGNELNKYLCRENTNNDNEDWNPLPQDYLQALDVALREGPNKECIRVGRSLYSSSMGEAKEIGGGAIGLRGFFQSLRPTQQGLALNVDLSVTAFHESIGIIPYLQKRLEFLRDIPEIKMKSLTLSDEEKKQVEKALKNIRVFVCHRDTVQRYRIYSLTDEVTENLWFEDRDGTRLRIVDYFKDHYGYDIEYKNLPCLQSSRSKPCYLPMELCVICEGQKFLGKLSDDQTTKIMKMGCQRPRERRAIINGVINGSVGPTSGKNEGEFKLRISREMTRLNGRVLRPPMLKLGAGGLVRELTPSRLDRQWNFLASQVVEGTRIERWALVSFGGTYEEKSNIPKFLNQLSLRCEQLGIYLNKSTAIPPQFEPVHVLNNTSLLELKLKGIKKAASNNLQLLLCLMEKKHKGYGELKRISETRVGVVSQCCLYSNVKKLSSNLLANLALKINAKVGGCTVALYNSLPSQIPRLLNSDEPVIFMGADVTHPHPLDDSSPSVAAVVGSINWPAANKYVSRMRSQTHRQEIIEDLGEMVGEILLDFYQHVSRLPTRIIFFRDGVSETQFYKVLKEELQSIRSGIARFFPGTGYRPLITFAVVQKRHHTRLFPDENHPSCYQFQDENIPPGTVVDTVITHPREFDFYLCSHWGIKGTSRPTHYHVLWDESKFSSDEFQKLVYSLCFTFVRCTKPISIVPPAYYAHLAAYRGRLYIDKSENVVSGGGRGRSGGDSCSSSIFSRPAPPKTVPLPEISDNVKKLMFYC